MESPPISFRALAQSAGNPASGGYPYAIRGDDLDKNFVAATAIYDEDHFEVTNTAGMGGHVQPKVKLRQILPDPPSNGFQILGGQNDAYSFLTGRKPGALISWVENIVAGEPGGWSTFAPTKNGQIPFFYKPPDGTTEQWSFLSPEKEGQLFYWDKTNGKWVSVSPLKNGQMIVWDQDNLRWELLTPGPSGSFPQWHDTTKWEVNGAGTVNGELLRWSSESEKWVPFGRGTRQNQLLMWGPNGWQAAPAPPATGKYVFGSVDGALGWIATEEC